MLIVQYYTLTILRIDINNILTDVQIGDVGNSVQCPWNNKGSV